MTLCYTEIPKMAPKTTRTHQWISKFPGYKINVQKSVCYFYMLTTNYQKEKLRNQSHLQMHHKEKVPRNKSKQEGKWSTLEKL